ncbi:retrotransposon protein, putative, ty1-copia subclass [Tanacetum coccineum]
MLRHLRALAGGVQTSSYFQILLLVYAPTPTCAGKGEFDFINKSVTCFPTFSSIDEHDVLEGCNKVSESSQASGNDATISEMALPVQNINHSAFRSMFEREKLSVYDAYNEVTCLILGSMTPELYRQFENSSPYDMIRELKSMFEKQAGVERFDLIQTFFACKQEEGKSVSSYVLKMKGYVEKLECLSYVLPQDISVGLILNGLTSDFAGFVRNYNMHNMGKTIGELHALLIEYEKGLPKKAATPQVMAIQGGRIKKSNKKSLNAKGKGKGKGKRKDKSVYIPKPKKPKPYDKEHPEKDDACHHYKEKHIEKLQHHGLLKSTDEESFDKCVSCLSGKMTRKPFPHRTKRATDLNGLIHSDVCGPLRHVLRQGASYFITFMDDYSRYGYVYLLKHNHEVFETFKVFKNEVENQLGKTIKALRSDRGGKYISQEFKDYLKACRILQQLTPLYTPQHNRVSERRNHNLLDIVRSMINLITLPFSFWDYALKSSTRILNMVPTKKVDKTPYELSYGKVDGFKPPQEEVIPVRRFVRTHQAPNRLCLNVEVDKHSLVDLNEPTDYKAAMLDLESDKWLDAMNAEMQSMKDNQVWCLVYLPPNAKGFIQTYGVDYTETFSPVADIRAIRILIAIAAFYDYDIWMDNFKRGHISMQERLDLNKTKGALDLMLRIDVPYDLAVGSIMFSDRCTRPDVAFAQNITSRFQQMSGEPHWNAVKTILKYLKNTKDMFLVYGGNPEAELRVDYYCDAGFETNRDDIKSQTGYVFVLNVGAVDWKSSKQSTIVMSAREDEYITASEVVMEAV